MTDHYFSPHPQAPHRPGQVRVILPGVYLELATDAGFTSDPVLPFFLERYAAAYRNELDAFITAVASGKAPKPDGEDGLKALLLADAATESAKTGQAVKL